ncbi:MAG: hypothetical protein BGO61_00205 [Thiobacillus sp. 65-69]|nr:tape measure protein [Thiobacillus sp.]ODU89167.1 MAG: hypothetical protein ABT21_09435 [Thiobacillus sp. SCN 65-179]OJW34480.1 MAG: hypothetical protein BGO61_00205 [Thiobacillus sp. 65-69]
MAIDIKAVLSAVDRTGPAMRSAQDGMNRMAETARRATAALAGIFSVREVSRNADEYAGLQARLKLASRSAEEFAAANDAVRRIATAAQAPLAETATLYTRIASSLKDVGVDQEAMTATTEAVALALRISGASMAEAQSAMLQFSQAIAGGALRGQEFNAVSQSAPRLLQALAAALGKPTGALREMAEEGKLTREVVIAALMKELPAMQAEAKLIPETLSGAFVVLRNEILITIGLIDQTTGATSKIARKLIEVADRLQLARDLIQSGGWFNAIQVTGGSDDINDYLKRTREEVQRTEKAIASLKFVGGSSEFLEERLRSLNAMLEVLIQNRVKALQAPPERKSEGWDNPARNTPPTPNTAPDKSALAAARRESEALKKAQEALRKAREDAEAQGLADGIEARRAALEAARKQELVDEETFIRAKAALDEEGLRNELDALQRQQAALRAASTDPRAKGSERTNALAELATVEARIRSAQDKILNLTVAAAADLAGLEAQRLTAQTEFIEGLEQEAFLAGLSNEAREQALLLLEAEKLGIKDVNRLLELQANIRSAENAKRQAEHVARQQDALYNSVQEGVQRAFADGLNAVASGEGGIRGALQNAVDAIRNALSNAIAGSLTESFLGMLGGKEGVLSIAGTLGLGGKRDGSNPANAIYVQDVAAALPAAAGAEGSVLGNFMTQIRSLFSSIGSWLSSLASRIGSLFSGGGSGGGLFSAIGSLFGFAEGGWTGPGGKYQPKGIVHGNEWVSTSEEVDFFGLGFFRMLRNIAHMGAAPRMPRMSYADGGAVTLPSFNVPAPNVHLRNVNLLDPDQLVGAIGQTRSFERAVLNVIQLNPGAVR